MRLSFFSATFTFLVAAIAVGQNQSFHPGAPLSYIAVGDSLELTPQNGFTVEAWIWPVTAGQSGTQFVLDKINPTPTPEAGNWSLNNEGGTMHFATHSAGGGASAVSSPNQPVQNAWTHLAVTYDGGALRMYENGIQVALSTAPGPVAFAPGELRIGCSKAAGNTWLGKIDDVRLWSVVRSPAQIMAGMSRPAEPDPDLVGAWRLDGTYLDVTGKHHGTPFGTISFQPGAPITTTLAAATTVAPGDDLVYSIATTLPGTIYAADVSLNGVWPGVPVGPGMRIALNPPYIFNESGGAIPQYFTGFLGVLDGAGHATAILHIPAAPWLGVYDVSASFVTFSPFGPLNIGSVGNSVTTVITGPAAVLTDVSPPEASALGGAPMTISGAGFHAGSTVVIGSVPVGDVVVASSTTIHCTVPAGPVGSTTVQVIDPLGAPAAPPLSFAYLTPLSITSVSAAINNPGTTVTINGQGMLPGITLTLGGALQPVTSVTPTAVTFTAPAGAPCQTTLVLTNPDGHSAQISYNPMPLIFSVNLNFGPAAGGNTVSLYTLIQVPWVGPFVVTADGIPCVVGSHTNISASLVMPPHAPGPVPIVLSYVGSGCSSNALTYTYQ